MNQEAKEWRDLHLKARVINFNEETRMKIINRIFSKRKKRKGPAITVSTTDSWGNCRMLAEIRCDRGLDKINSKDLKELAHRVLYEASRLAQQEKIERVTESEALEHYRMSKDEFHKWLEGKLY